MWVSTTTLSAFDQKVDDEGYPSKSSVIAYLLTGFLENRSNHTSQEMVRVTTLIDRVTYTKLSMVGAAQGKKIEEVIDGLCKAHIAHLSGTS